MNDINIITAAFRLGESSITTLPSYKYDSGQILKITGITLPPSFEVYFSNTETGDSEMYLGSNYRVEIPDKYFLSGKPVFCFITLYDSTGSRTKYKIIIPVHIRSNISPNNLTPEDKDVINQTIVSLNEAVITTNRNAQQTTADVEEIRELKEHIDNSDYAESARINAGNAEQAKNTAVEAANNAINAKNSADESAISASDSASSAQTSANNAQIFMQSAESAKNIAIQEANRAERIQQEITSDLNNLDTTINNTTQTFNGLVDEATTFSQTAEAWAVGKKNNVDVATTDAQYHNNSKYYAEQASQTANQINITATSVIENASRTAELAQVASEKADIATNKASEADNAKVAAVSAKDDAVSAKDRAEQIVSEIQITVDTAIQTAKDSGMFKGDKGDKGDPGISPTIDSTLSQANQAADAKAVGDKIDEITLTIDETLTQSGQVADAKVTGDALNTKADQNGYYENLNVGVADQLASKNYIEDNEAYTFRPTGGGAKVGAREFDTIVGGSVVWNQLASFASEKIPTPRNGLTFTSDDNKSCTINGTSTSAGGASGWFNFSEAQTFSKDRIGHIYIFTSKHISGTGLDDSCYFGFDSVIDVIGGTAYPGESRVLKLNAYESGSVRIVLNFRANKTFTDYKFTLQCYDITAMFGSTIADYIYSLEQATAGAGVAWFRKYFPNEYYDYNPGELMHVSGVSAHKTYDADESVIGNYPLDSSLTLRGIPKLVDGKLSFDGDIYKPDGTVERRYGVLILDGTQEELKSVNWRPQTNSVGFYYNFTDKNIAFPSSNETPINAVANSLEVVSYEDIYSNDVSSIAVVNISVYRRVCCRIKDTSLTTKELVNAYLAQHPITLVYELAEPTTEQAAPYQSPQIINPYGTEEYVTTSIIPVGHQTQYPEDLRAKIESLPWDFANLIAPVEATYKATQNYTAGSLFIINNILYKATANIANGGTITPNTNCTPTTLAEIIAAL